MEKVGKKKKILRTDEEILAGLSHLVDEEEIIAYFKGVVKELNHIVKLNNRRHKDHRADFDISSLEGGFDEDDAKIRIPNAVIELCSELSVEPLAFSGNAVSMPNLVNSPALSRILGRLTDKQQETLYLRGVHLWENEDIAKENKVSSRNIRKLNERALYHTRGQFLPVVKLKLKLSTAKEYKEIAEERRITTTFLEREFLRRFDGQFDDYYEQDIDK